MKNFKKGFIIVSIFLILIVAVVIFKVSKVNYVKYYSSNVDVKSNGDIEVSETLVVDYRTWQNYIYRDIKYSKDHNNNPVFKKLNVDYNKLSEDVPTLDTSTIEVRCYRGDIIDGSMIEDVEDITDSCYIGYSFNNDYDKNGNKVACPPNSGRCDSIYIDASNCGTLVGLMSFTYKYTINGMVTSYNDCQELNYKMFEYMGMKVKMAAVTVTLPNNDLDSQDFYCYGHGLSNGKVIQNKNRSFDYLAKVGSNEEFEFRVVFPQTICNNIPSKHKIDVNALKSILDYENDLYEKTRISSIAATIGNIFSGLVGLLMIYIFYYVYKKYDKEFTPEFDLEYLRELPFNYSPAEMSYLYYFKKTQDEDVTATLLDLIRRKFIELEYFGDVTANKPDFSLILKRDYYNEFENTLKPHEKHLIKWFFDDIAKSDRLEIKVLEKYGKKYEQAKSFESNSNEFKEHIIKETKNYDWFIDTTKQKEKSLRFISLPIITFIILAVLGKICKVSFEINCIIMLFIGAIFIIYVLSIKKRSKNGNEEYAKWNAFKRFMVEFSSFEDYPIPSIVVWEEFLVYATSLKIADKVMRQLKVHLPSLSSDNGTYMSGFTYYHINHFYFTNRISSSINTVKNQSLSSISAHNGGHGGGHGGGFSGGSSFGGGGGGFRGGR